MMAIGSTNSATPSLQATLVKARLEQAQRDADLAQDKVESLKEQTDQAAHELQEKRETVHALATQTTLNDTTYVSQLRAARSAVPVTTQDFLVRMYTATAAKFSASGNALKSDNSKPSVNFLGQTIGRIVDLHT